MSAILEHSSPEALVAALEANWCDYIRLFGLAPQVEIRVWDTTADTRYMVLPVQPPATIGWPEEKLAAIVSKDSMIGVARL